MSHGTSHRKRSRRQSEPTGGFGSGKSKSSPLLVQGTDVCWWLTFVATTVCFGGRAAIGQAVLVCGATITALCWLLHRLTSAERKYNWTGSEWLWCAGLLVGMVQIVPLPQDWLLAISPHIKDSLPLWFSGQAPELVHGGWRQLSLAPWETASGVATFLAYAILFLVIAQRVQTVSDVERTLCGVVLAGMSMSAFALAQFYASNGKFFWFMQHPFMTTDGTPHGCFTNHNHLAQFLAMSSGPLIWWILRPASSENESSFNGSSQPLMRAGAFAVLMGLGTVDLTVLLTASRGGLLALGLTTLFSGVLLCRFGLVAVRFIAGLCCAGAVAAVIFFFTGYESLALRLDDTAEGGAKTSGRLEIWQANLQVASDFPFFGTGVGTHQDAHQLHLNISDWDEKVFTHAESSILQVASETGMAGLAVAILMILTSAWWCICAMRNPETRIKAAAAVIFASLIANIGHAVFDFFWYTPSCMLMLAVQLACACRLAALTRQSAGRSVWTWSLPRPIILVAGCGLAAVSTWMVNQKLPAALAEPDYTRYLNLTWQEQPQEEDERLAAEEERCQSVLRAVRFNPHDSRMQEEAGVACLEMFDARQKQQSENPLPYAQIRDTVSTSEFESEQALHEWLQRAVGRNLKLLHRARKHFYHALQASPLRAHTYVKLVELEFLNQSDPDRITRYLQQALKLRPRDPHVLFAVGKNILLTGDLPGAMKYWRAAFQRSPKIRNQIIKLLAGEVAPEFFMKSFDPDWTGLQLLARAYAEAGRTEEAREIWLKVIDEGSPRLKIRMPANERETVALALRDAYFAIEEPHRGIRVLMTAQKQLPYSMPLRTCLGWDLYAAGRYAEAAEHLQWCAARKPDDKNLQDAAAMATKERLKSASSGPGSNPS